MFKKWVLLSIILASGLYASDVNINTNTTNKDIKVYLEKDPKLKKIYNKFLQSTNKEIIARFDKMAKLQQIEFLELLSWVFADQIDIDSKDVLVFFQNSQENNDFNKQIQAKLSAWENTASILAKLKLEQTEQVAEVLTLEEILVNIQNDVEEYAKANEWQIPLWIDEVEMEDYAELVEDGLWEDVKETVFEKNQVEDYAKMIFDLSPNSAIALIQHKWEKYDDVVKYMALRVKENNLVTKEKELNKKIKEIDKQIEQRKKNIKNANTIASL